MDEAAAEGVSRRLLGGMGIRVRTRAVPLRPELARDYNDIDCIAPRKTDRVLSCVFTNAGYSPDARFNAIHGARRLLFRRDGDGRQIDVFLDEFQMCYRIDLGDRLQMAGASPRASDFLLLKLQIVELDPKAETDILSLLLAQRVADVDEPDAISTRYIARICADDWGWFTTIHHNLEGVRTRSRELLEIAADVELAESRIHLLLGAIESAPKSLRWRMRGRVGRRSVWYELPEEVG